MRPVAILDIGSNSLKLLVAVRQGEVMRIMRDELRITRLGQSVSDGGCLRLDAVERTLEAVVELYALARKLDAVSVLAAGTMALRQAQNRGELVSAIKRETGLRVRVLSGREEARLSYHGAIRGLAGSDERLLMFDTGGGSTELVFGRGEVIERDDSLPLGAGNLTEAFLPADPPSDEQIQALLAHIRSQLGDSLALYVVDRVVGVGGTVTTIAAMERQMATYDGDIVHGSILSRDSIAAWLWRLGRLPLEQRRRLVGLHPGRAPVIVAGVSVVLAVSDLCGVEQVTVSDHGLRHGLWWEETNRLTSNRS